MRWRRAERERLIKARLALDLATRAALVARIAGQLDALLGDLRGRVVSAWLPFRGEPNLRPWMAAAAARGAITALPVAETRGRPLRFRTWRPGEALAPGPWNIPVPAGGDMVIPDLVLAPVVGFDGEGFRLGYGGGFFDRTLAALTPRPGSASPRPASPPSSRSRMTCRWTWSSRRRAARCADPRSQAVAASLACAARPGRGTGPWPVAGNCRRVRLPA